MNTTKKGFAMATAILAICFGALGALGLFFIFTALEFLPSEGKAFFAGVIVAAFIFCAAFITLGSVCVGLMSKNAPFSKIKGIMITLCVLFGIIILSSFNGTSAAQILLAVIVGGCGEAFSICALVLKGDIEKKSSSNAEPAEVIRTIASAIHPSTQTGGLELLINNIKNLQVSGGITPEQSLTAVKAYAYKIMKGEVAPSCEKDNKFLQIKQVADLKVISDEQVENAVASLSAELLK